MKLTALLLCFFISAFSYAQSDLTISSTRVMELRLGAPVDSVNMYLANKIKLLPLTDKDVYRYDTVQVTYKDIPLRLIFTCYYDDEHKKASFTLGEIYSENAHVRTRSGISVNYDKFDVIKKLDGSYLNVSPDADKGKEYSTVVLYDQTNFTQMIFYFRNNVLYAIACSNLGADAC